LEAKDTVMKKSRIEGLFTPSKSPNKDIDPSDHNAFMQMLQNLCTFQAEISFKAGIKEVVEYVKQNLLLYGPDYDDKVKWQAKLKEWELEATDG